MRHLIKRLLLFLLIVSLQELLISNTTLSEDKIPERFKHLYNTNKTRIVDVFFNRKKIAETKIEYIDSKVRFIDVPNLISSFTTIKLEHINEIKKLLEYRDFNSNHKNLCHEYKVPSYTYHNICNHPVTNSIDIVFNSFTDQVFIYVNTSFLTPEPLWNQYISTPTSDFSILNKISGIYSSEGINTPTSYNLKNDSYFSKKNFVLKVRSNYFTPFETHDSIFKIDEINLSQRTKGKRLQYGMIQSEGNQLFSNKNILGFSVNNDYQLIKGGVKSITPITFSISQPTNIKVYQKQEKRLIYSQDFFLPGPYTLNTFEFPEGSYTIQIEFDDKSGKKSTREMFFIKSELFPNTETPKYNISFGFNESEKKPNSILQEYDINKPSLIGNYYWGLPPYSAFSVGTIIMNNQLAVNFSQLFNYKKFNMQTSSAITNNFNYGLSGNFGFNIGAINANSNISYYREKNKNIPKLIGIAPGVSISSNISLATNYKDISLNVSNSYHVQENLNLFDLQVSMPLISTNGFSINANIGSTLSKNDKQVIFGISLSQSNDFFDLSANFNNTKNNMGESNSLVTSIGKRVNVKNSSANIRLTNISDLNSDNTQILSINYDSPIGDARFKVNNESKATNVNLSFNSSLVYSDGYFGMGKKRGVGGILVVVDSDKEQDYELKNTIGEYLGNGNSYINTFHPSSLFKSQRIDLITNSLASTESNRSQEFVIYPGNIQLFKVSIVNKTILLGQIYKEGRPASGKLQMIDGKVLQDIINGNIRIIVPTKTKKLELMDDNLNKCVITLPALSTEKSYKWFDRLNCENKKES
jgi:hypothetical protein